MSGTLRLRGSTSGYSELQAPAVAADQTFVLPTAGGTLLTTDSPVPKLTLELGSASQPSLTFQGDTDTGLFSEGTNTLNLVTGGSSKVVLGAAAHTIYAGTGATVRAIDIDSSGNVGVGTSSPVGRLTVIGSAGSGDDGVQITSGSTTTGSKAALFFMPSTTASVATGSAIKSERLSPDGSDLQFYTVSALGNTPVRAMTIDKSQRVGIGTTSPATLLDIRPGATGAQNAITMGYGRAANPTDAVHKIRWASDDLIIEADSANTIASNIQFRNDGNEVMRIDSSGRVGVGTSSPSNQLHLHTTTTSNVLQLTNSATGTAAGDGMQIVTSSLEMQLRNREAGPTTFYTSNLERMRIDSSGNVGIGRNNPTAKLALQTDADEDAIQLSGYNFLKWNGGNQLHYGGYDSNHWGTLTFSTSGSERMRIDSSGNVGIGESSPSYWSSRC